MNEQEVRVQAVIAEMHQLIIALQNRCLSLAGDLAVAKAALAAEKANTEQ